MNGTKIEDSSLFISSTMGANFFEKDLKFRNDDIVITRIYIGPGIAVAYADYDRVVCVSVDGGDTWRCVKFPFKIKQIEINFFNPYKVAAITEYNYLYFMINNGSNWLYRTYGVMNGSWEYGSTFFYYIQNTYIGYNLYRKDLFRASPDSYSITRILLDVYKFSSGLKLLWAVVKEGTKMNLYISYAEEPFKKASFPSFLKPKDYFVHSARQKEIFVILVNDTNQVYLYSAIIGEWKFWKLSDDVGKYYDSTQSFCVDFESFGQLPGVLLGQKLRDSTQSDQPYTTISYSHGMKWTHVNAPRMVDGRLCEWPSCFLKIHMRCTATNNFRPISTVEGSPALMVAHGSIIRSNEKEVSGVFISTDAGKSWIRGLRNIHSYTLLDKGGVIFTYPEYSHEAYYSYDFGLTWKLANITRDTFRALATYQDSNGVSLVAATVGYDEDTMDWSFIKIDFSNVLQKDCNLNDYELFTPGASKNDQCFQGKRNSVYRRKHNVTCKSIIDQLPKVESLPCPCGDDDFGCSYGYYLKNGDCIADPDYIPDDNSTCKGGDFTLKPSSKSKLIGDVCISNGKYVDTESDICLYTDNDDTISILVGKVIKFSNLNNNQITDLIKLPINVKSFTNLISYDVDHSERCIYYANGTGIIRMCWNRREEAISQNEYLFVKDTTLLGLEIDEFTDNLYFYNKSTISVINVFSRYRKTLVKSDYEIYYFNIFPTTGFMTYVYNNGHSSTKSDNIVAVYSLSGEQRGTVTTGEKINAIAFSKEENKLYIYCNDVYYKSKTDGTQKEKFTHDIKNLLKAYVKNNRKYFVTENYVSVDNTRIYQNFISDSDLHLTSDHAFKSDCSISPCKYLCFSDENKGYRCGCPETMTPTDDGNDCACDSLHPKCKECKDNEFVCANQKCIDRSGRCNGVDNCGDGSDELNCTLVCKADETSCDNSTKCIDATKICDGVKDCDDGTDEVSCNEIPKCEANQFLCINGNCIPVEKVCDGNNDCGDFSDEDSCDRKDCKSFEVKCNNGECILPSQICNNVFDCSDWSDELNCGGKIDTDDPNCVIRCDGKCIPREKMCDHITDCSEGQDEINCAHIFDCPLPGQEKCLTSFSCYDASRKCDGFAECEDGSDESDCPDFNYCSDPESFVCESDRKCIPINSYCNSVPNCDDKSDEGVKCLNNPMVQSIQIDKRGAGFMDISWSVSNPKKNTAYNVTLIPKFPGQKVEIFKTIDTSITLNNLIECQLYTVYVRIFGSIAGRAREFVAKRPNRGVPNNFDYDISANKLSWTQEPSECIPEMFYIECSSGDQLAYRNFSKSPTLDVKYNDSFECRVSSCLATIFNISCSDFTRTIFLSSYNAGQNFVKIGLPILIVIILLIVGGFMLFKLYKSGKLQFIKDFLSKRSGFQKVSTTQPIDAGKLFEESEDSEL